MTFGTRSAHRLSMCLKKLGSFGEKVHSAFVRLTRKSGRSVAQMCMTVSSGFEGGDPAR